MSTRDPSVQMDRSYECECVTSDSLTVKRVAYCACLFPEGYHYQRSPGDGGAERCCHGANTGPAGGAGCDPSFCSHYCCTWVCNVSHCAVGARARCSELWVSSLCYLSIFSPPPDVPHEKAVIFAVISLYKQSSEVFDQLFYVMSPGRPVDPSPAEDYGQSDISGSCNINYSRRDRRHFDKCVRDRGRVPRERPSASLSRQQAHTLPCAWGESAVGGISHTAHFHQETIGRTKWWSGFIGCGLFFVSSLCFRSALAYTCQPIMPLKTAGTMWRGMDSTIIHEVWCLYVLMWGYIWSCRYC